MRLLLLICVASIFALGLVMVFNTSSAEVLDRSLSRSMHQALLRQIVYALIATLLAMLVWRIGYEDLLKLSPYLLLVGIALLLLVFIPPFGQARNGAHRWVGIARFTFQPSELIKYLVPMCYIEWVLGKTGVNISFKAFCKIVAFLSFPMLLVMIEPDNGAAAVIGLSLIPLFFLSHIRFRYWALPVLLLMAIGTVAACKLPYVRGRIDVYLHPEKDLQGKGHQAYQAKIAAGSGKLFGRGPGGSLQKLTYLPEAQNDYIAAIFAEEFGFFGMLLLIMLYMLFTFGGFSIALRAPTLGGCYLGMIITFLIAFQAFLNLGVVSGLLPSKGVNLPFFSQGGTSLIANILGFSILLNIGYKGDVKVKARHS